MSGNQGFRGWAMPSRTGAPLVVTGFTNSIQIPTHADLVLVSQSIGQAVESCWLEPGQYNGQRCTIINISPSVSDEITFTTNVVNSSFLFGSDRAVLKVNQAIQFTWVDFTQLSDYKASSPYIASESGGWYFANPNAYRALSTQTLSNNSQIATPLFPEGIIIPVTCAADVTGITIIFGYDGQQITVINTSAHSITFAAVGTSNVADGTSDVITATTARRFLSNSGVWYPLK